MMLNKLLPLFILLASFNAFAEEVKEKFAGLTVNAELMMADGKTFKDDFVLITHGTLTHKGRSTYAVLQELLAEEHGVSSLAINLSLGLNDRQGEYPCETTHTHKHTDAMKEINFWLNWLKDKGVKQVTLLGHSRGGNQTAWFLTEMDQPMIKNAVLVAPATWSNEAMATEYKDKYGKDLPTLLAKAEKLVKQGQGDTLMKNINFIYCKDTSATAAAFADYYQNNTNMDTPTLLKKVKKPTLVIMGSDDNVVADLPEKMKKIKNPLVSSYTVEDADHFFLDFAAEDLAAQTAEFVQQ